MVNPTQIEELDFIMTCYKHSGTKLTPDFTKVAQELKLKNANAAYHRHWGLLKKFGMTGTGNQGRKKAVSNEPGTTTTPKAEGGGRKRPAAKSAPTTKVGDTSDKEEEKSDGEQEKCKEEEDLKHPTKKVKTEADRN